MIRKYYLLRIASLLLLLSACGENITQEKDSKKKTAVLLVNHGSRSETWRNALLQLEKETRDSIMASGEISEVRTAFMEYTEPSIATQLKALDAAGYTDVIMVPVFLTVSPHSFDDIPTIIGQKEDPQSMEVLKIEKIERYTPKAKVEITPLLDFTSALQQNILRRYKALSKNPSEEGLVLMAYGDESYLKEWTTLLDNTGKFIEKETGAKAHSWGWCGHVAHYEADSTTAAIARVQKSAKTAVVVPVLVAHDEMFQIKIIGDGINKVPNHVNTVLYNPDAILPDNGIKNWVIEAVQRALIVQ